ncbi:MAG: type III-A CRISPR-associated protein Csm2 [Spirulina sp. DLM2.Bin59]|nr:MAG: type III-A CRISPR-associated protein Csm2 [Spirulina sp. DLM2.Bin59]
MQQDFDKLAKNGGLQNYKISQLVEDSEDLGELLFRKKLKTNQIRKFLDNIKRFKVEFARNKKDFDANKDQLNILRYHLAYLAARQAKNDDPGPVEPLKKVLESAIKGVNELEDFERLVQLIEAIIAYHKAAGGSNQ